MKSKVILTIITAALVGGCIAQKKPVVTHQFPPAMSASVREGYIEMWKKGQILYDLNCSGCHNQVVKRKVIIPEFTEEQLAAYEVRIADPKHEMSLSETKVNAEELGLITIFLTYRKHDSVALKKVIESRKDHDHNSSL